ncbi:acetyltransferase [Spirosoma utsteinense]|uniref:Sugar O-acyltransferase (Sialic acid O-acetyltransferase NeuD family) n=1 Tax=Spirosoma utsteinense TaxID=2585773 RepID=A0ABR6W8R9_9BACT|nr:acetyltransferase [Spirosoma utsteinense]MBC3787283.1 sugar O-acyltransferase (sialic acid O-acetyltransferase NeuD family) [Spirosoma utsteinense]MBC3792969.1 sugar O-acyltransferase (sialic acid O-acetyltransferase NeuD family) [Spirosoma utsteinense]
MSKEQLILVGGGGHCKSVIDVVEASGQFSIAGIVDTREKLGTTQSGYAVVATDDDIEALAREYRYFLVTVGQIRSSAVRTRLYHLIKSLGGTLTTVISPTAYVSHRALIGEGTVIHHQAFVNAGAQIGVNCIINTGSLIEHDARIGDHCHVSTGAVVNGDCLVGDHCFVGSRAILSHGVHVAPNGLIGAGAVLLTNSEEGGLYAGNPAVLKKRVA